MKEKPLISIITVCYNAEKDVVSTIQNVISQNEKNIEYIIIDAASDDNTVNEIKKYQKIAEKNGILYEWISEPDNGIYDAMNKGIAIAKGKYIHFLNSGDLFCNDNILLEVSKILKQKEPSLLVGGSIHRKPTEKIEFYHAQKIKSLSSFYRNGRMVCHQSIFHNIKTFEKYGDYSLEYKIIADHEWLLRFLYHKSENEIILNTEIPIIYYDMGGISANNRKSVIRERNRLIQEYDLGYTNFLIAKLLIKIEHLKLIGITILKKFKIYRYYRKIKYR